MVIESFYNERGERKKETKIITEKRGRRVLWALGSNESALKLSVSFPLV